MQTAYLDVCDDTSYAWRAKSFMSRALAANVPAITTGGIYPGVSNGAYCLLIIYVQYSYVGKSLLPESFVHQFIFN